VVDVAARVDTLAVAQRRTGVAANAALPGVAGGRSVRWSGADIAAATAVARVAAHVDARAVAVGLTRRTALASRTGLIVRALGAERRTVVGVAAGGDARAAAGGRLAGALIAARPAVVVVVVLQVDARAVAVGLTRRTALAGRTG